MPIYSIEGPDGRIYDIEGPEGASDAQVIAALQQHLANAPAPKKGLMAALEKGAESTVSSGVTGLQALFGSPEEAAKAGLERGERISDRYADQIGLDQLKKAYQEKGLLAAGKELARQVPLALAEQAPNIGATVAGGRLGAFAGSPFGPVGSLIGGVAGAAAPSLIQQFGGNIERQAAEQKAKGEPLNISTGAAGAAAVPQAALDVAGTFIPFGGRLVSKLTGIPESALVGRTAAQAQKLAEERLAATLLKGTATGIAAEVPTEITQQMLERLQAGLPLTDEAALNEYGQTAYQVGLLGPIGAAGRISDKAGARQQVQADQASQAAAAAEEARKQEEERLASPDYALELGERFDALRAQAEELLKTRGKKPAKNAPEEQHARYEAHTQQIKDLHAQIRDLSPEYNAIKDKLPGLREQRRIDALTPQQYYYEQMGMKSDAELAAEQAAKAAEDPMKAWLDKQVAGVPAAPVSALQKDFDDALGGLRHFDMLTPADVADVLTRNPVLMQKVYNGELSVPEFSAKQNRELKDLLKLQVKDLAGEMAKGRTEAAQARAVEEKTAEKVQGEAEALQRIGEKPTPVSTTATLSGITSELEKQADAKAPGVSVEPGLQKQNYRTLAQPHAETAAESLLSIQEAKNDIERGNTLDNASEEKRRFASTTTDMLRKRIDDEKQRYADAILNEVANLRQAENQQPLDKDTVKLAVAQIRSAIDAFSTGQASEAALRRQLDVVRSRLLTYRPSVQKVSPDLRRQYQSYEAEKIAEARGDTAQTLEGQLRRQRDYVGGLIERALPMGSMPRDARESLSQVQDAIDAGTATRDMLDRAEDIASRIMRGQSVRGDVAGLDAAISSMRQAQAPGLEGGQQSLFGTEDLGIIRATAANFRRFLESKEVAKLRALLPKVEAVVQREAKKQERPGVDAQFYRNRIDTLEKQIAERKEALEDLGGASWQEIMETRAVLPAEVQAAKQRLYALMQEQNTLEMEEAEARKQKPTSKRGPYAAAQAETKVSKLKQQIENKEANILTSIRELTARIKEQRKAAIYGPIIAEFEKRAADAETQLAKLEESMPEGGTMSPELDDLYNEASDLRTQIATARAEIAKVQERAEAMDGNEALLAAADARIVKEKDKLADLQEKLAGVDLVGDERRAAQAEANKKRQEIAVAEGALREAKELQAKQTEARKSRLISGEGTTKLVREVVPVEYTTKSGKKIVAKEKGTGLPLQRKKTTGAYAERTPIKGVDWQTKKAVKPVSKERTLSLENEEDVKAERRRLIREAVQRGDMDEATRLRAEGRAEAEAKAQRAPATENLKDYSKVAGTLARQATVTDVTPRPKKKKELLTGSPESKEARLKRVFTAAEKRKLARDAAEGAADDDTSPLAFRTAKTDEAVVDPTDAKARIVEIKSRLPKGMNLVYEPTLEGMKPETLAMLEAAGYKAGTQFKGVVLPDGTIVVVGDAHTSLQDLEETLFHEMVGHYGVDTVIGHKVLKAFAHNTNLETLAKKLGGDQLWNDAVAAMNFAVEQKGDPDLAALREIIAYTAQQRITESFKAKAGRWLQQLVGMVRAALRAMGFKNMTDMSTSDVFYAIKQANKAFNDRTLGPYRAADGTMAFRTQQLATPLARSFVASEKSAKDKLLGNIMGLTGRVQFVDQYAALSEALKKGVDNKVISDLEAEQAEFYLRYGQQRSQFATQALTNGPLSLVSQETKRGKEFIYKSNPGASLVKVAAALEKSGIKNSTQLEAMFTAYMAGKRAKQVGWEKLNVSNPALAKKEYDEVMQQVNGDERAKTAFAEAASIYREYNNGLLDFLVQTGAMSASRAAELKKMDYVPFYRVNKGSGDVELMVDKEHPIRIANIKDEPHLHELVGDNTQILPIFTSATQNAFMLTDMGLRNQMVKDSAMLLKRMGIASTFGRGAGPTGNSTIRFKVKGEDHFAVVDTDMYGIPADLIVKGMEGIKTTIPAAVKLMGIPADLLRKFVTRNPAYAVRQAIRDPLTAWMTNGTSGVPVLNSFKELSGMVAGRSEAERKLMESGAVSSNVLTGDERDMQKALRELTQGKSGWAKLMARADAFAMQGDAATRAVIYKDSIDKGMSEMQALLRTLESMNFGRRGLSPSMQMLSTVIPFFNAQIQGLDVLYRAFTGKMPYEKQLQIKQKLMTRGLMLAAGTLAYASAMEDDEAYKNAKPEERLGNWFVHTPLSDEPVRIPIPFELGYLFKALPEAMFNMAADDERANDITKGMTKLVGMSNPFSLPQAIKPATEVVLGRSFFGGDIESARERTQLLPTERYRESSTEVAKLLGSVTGDAGLTPIKIDYLMRGYTGGLGIALIALANPLLNTEESQDVPKPTTKTSKQPFIGGLFQPVEGRGTIDAAYERMLEIQQAKGTYEKLMAEGKKDEAKEFVDTYANKLAAASVSGAVQQQLGDLAKKRRMVVAAPNISTEQKDKLLEQIDAAQLKLARQFLSATGETRPR